MSLPFPRAARLTRSSEFLAVRKEGRSHAGRHLVLGVLRGRDSQRVGIITSRRVGNAVIRNRVRRRLREIVRHSRPDWLPGLWVVVIARNPASRASHAELQAEWQRLARRASILAPPHPSLPPAGESQPRAS